MLVHTIKDCSTHVRKKKQTKLDLCSAQLDVVFLIQSDWVIQHTLTLHCVSNTAFWFSGRKQLSFCCIPICNLKRELRCRRMSILFFNVTMLMMKMYALLGTMYTVATCTCVLDHMTLPALVAWSLASLRSELHDSFGLEEWLEAPAWNNSHTCM